MAGSSRSRSALVGVGVLASLACEATPIVRAEIEVVIDTDVPLPSQADDPASATTTIRIDRLRVDVYDASGATWIDSRELGVGDVADWPVTFGVASEPDDEERSFRLRLRAYPSGRLEEVFVRDASGSLVLDAAGAPMPVFDLRGAPLAEPRTVFAIDRIVIAKLVAGQRRRVQADLLGDCIGVRADVLAGTSCVDGGPQPVAMVLGESATEPPGDLPASKVGTWPRARGAPCALPPRSPTPELFDDEVCIPGGVFHFGDDRVVGIACPPPLECDGYPERIVALSPFLMDRFHVTVARYRAALLHPTNPFEPGPFELPVPRDHPDFPGFSDHCTWTGPDPAITELDDRPLVCINRAGARAYCAWAGGDLPTEAQLEYVATAAGRPVKTLFPWGDAPATCDGVVFGRAPPSLPFESHECSDLGFPSGIPSVAATFGAAVLDMTPPPTPDQLGVVGLGALASHLTRDAWQPLDGPCWVAAPRVDPTCEVPTSELVSQRGASFVDYSFQLQSAIRFAVPTPNFSYELGFRCVRGGAPP